MYTKENAVFPAGKRQDGPDERPGDDFRSSSTEKRGGQKSKKPARKQAS